jgi:hypothetical protein
MTEQTTDDRKYQTGELVRVQPTPPDGVAYATVIAFIDRDAYQQCADDHHAYGQPDGTGPLYLVNVGNVFHDRYQKVYAESALTPLAPDDSGIDEIGRHLQAVTDPPF